MIDCAPDLVCCLLCRSVRLPVAQSIGCALSLLRPSVSRFALLLRRSVALLSGLLHTLSLARLRSRFAQTLRLSIDWLRSTFPQSLRCSAAWLRSRFALSVAWLHSRIAMLLLLSDARLLSCFGLLLPLSVAWLSSPFTQSLRLLLVWLLGYARSVACLVALSPSLCSFFGLLLL